MLGGERRPYTVKVEPHRCAGFTQPHGAEQLGMFIDPPAGDTQRQGHGLGVNQTGWLRCLPGKPLGHLGG